MQRVLSRAVKVEGVDYAEGTPLDKVPEGNHASLIGTGWTRLDPDPVEHADDPDGSDDSAGDDDAPDPDAPAGDPLPDSPPDANDTADESPTLTELGLSDELSELLSGANVTTKAEAIRYRETNGSFRTIKGIGKVSDGLINTLLDQ